MNINLEYQKLRCVVFLRPTCHASILPLCLVSISNVYFLGKFLCEAGWYRDAEDILARAFDVCSRRVSDEAYDTWFVAAGAKLVAVLLRAQSGYCRFQEVSDNAITIYLSIYSFFLYFLNHQPFYLSSPLFIDNTCSKKYAESSSNRRVTV